MGSDLTKLSSSELEITIDTSTDSLSEDSLGTAFRALGSDLTKSSSSSEFEISIETSTDSLPEDSLDVLLPWKRAIG